MTVGRGLLSLPTWLTGKGLIMLALLLVGLVVVGFVAMLAVADLAREHELFTEGI